MVGLSLIFVVGCSNEKEKALQHRMEIEQGKATAGGVDWKICEIYRKNQLKAQEEFENKIIVVTGKVVGVGVFDNDPSLLYVDFGTFDGYDLLVQFRDVYKKDLAKLNPGDIISIQGECFKREDVSTIYINGARIVSPAVAIPLLQKNSFYR